jgi:hypothetical protein
MSARTILIPPLLNELNDLLNGTGTSDITASTITASTITATDYVVLGTTGGINAVLECTATNTVQVGNVSGGAPAGNISCAGITATGVISTEGAISASGAISSDGAMTAGNGLTVSNGSLTLGSSTESVAMSINGGTAIQYLTIVSVSGIQTIGPGSGSGSGLFTTYTQANVFVSSSPSFSVDTSFVFSNASNVPSGGIIINGVSLAAPLNGELGYCDITFQMSNMTDTAITPTTFQVLIIGY